jgi:hypothetical protein
MNLLKKSEIPLQLHLTGGLGNELFQIAAALYSSESKKVAVEWVFGKPRVNISNLPQIECYELPPAIRLLTRSKNSWLASKTLGYLLRSSIEPRWLEKNIMYRNVSKLLGSAVLSLRFGKFRFITTGDNVGFYPLKVDNRNRYLLGYFQSYKYSENENVFELLKSLKVKNFQNYSMYKELAATEEPLVVHVRLADYREEDNFGIPELKYYHDAVTDRWKSGNYKSIWLFSDEPQNAIDRIPQELQGFIRSFGDVENCIAKTLEVMRLGKGYVIANSSFSWWGARLSISPEPVVVAPKPWFSKLNEPEFLIPPAWIRFDGWDTSSGA